MKTPQATLAAIAELVRKELGIVYQEANYYQLETRLEELVRTLELPGITELDQLIRSPQGAKARSLLLDLATNNETSFFRDGHIFPAIVELLVGQTRPGRSEPVNIWSAACSYGQEIYSLAMELTGSLNRLPARGFEILATDISDRALQSAQKAVYNDLQVQRGLTPTLLDRYFTPLADKREWQIKPDLRRGIRFQKQNLLDSFEGLGTFDLILCRNVLIYQTVESRRGIIRRLAERLTPGGHLILGASESLIGLSEDFELVREEKSTFYRRGEQLKKAG